MLPRGKRKTRVDAEPTTLTFPAVAEHERIHSNGLRQETQNQDLEQGMPAMVQHALLVKTGF